MRIALCVSSLVVSAVLVGLAAWVDSGFFWPVLVTFAVAVFTAPFVGGGDTGGSSGPFPGDGGPTGGG